VFADPDVDDEVGLVVLDFVLVLAVEVLALVD